jgi:hypothetical protein
MRYPAHLLLGAVLFTAVISGCEQVVKVTDSQRICGKWKGSLDAIEFFSNGDYRAYAVLATHNGKWQILEGNRLKITMDSRWLPDGELRYEFAGDKLILTDMGGNVKLEYQREK